MNFLVFFVLGYTICAVCISVLYHRGLAHQSITLTPRTKKFVLSFGNWITGIDPLAWSCMHRLHHLHTDTPKDPHSPKNYGIRGTFYAQYRAYNTLLARLIRKDPKCLALVQDIGSEVHWLNRDRLWFVPYLAQGGVALGISGITGSFLCGPAFYLGLMSHPIQGWLVNSLGHSVGYRNFDTPDHSTNNLTLGWLVLGEGFQNNHHERPQSPKFSVQWWEVDLGFGFCHLFQLLGLSTMDSPFYLAGLKKLVAFLRKNYISQFILRSKKER